MFSRLSILAFGSLLVSGVHAVILSHNARATSACPNISVISPLYIYPTSTSVWQPLVSASTANPSVPLQVVINPGNGSGSSTPDPSYAAGIAYLRANLPSSAQLRVLGYVYTSYGKRNSSDVFADIANYTAWPTASRPDGIFFDEAADQQATLYQSYAAAVRNATWHDPGSVVVLNPGAPVQTSYFSFADNIIVFENAYAAFYPTGENTLTSNAPSYPAGAASVLTHSAPQGNTTATRDFVKDVCTAAGAAAGPVYYTDLNIATTDVYGGFGSQLDTLFSAVADARAGTL